MVEVWGVVSPVAPVPPVVPVAGVWGVTSPKVEAGWLVGMVMRVLSRAVCAATGCRGVAVYTAAVCTVAARPIAMCTIAVHPIAVRDLAVIIAHLKYSRILSKWQGAGADER